MQQAQGESPRNCLLAHTNNIAMRSESCPMQRGSSKVGLIETRCS